MTLEDTLSFPFVTANTSDVPTAPDATPTYDVYEPNSSTKRLSAQSASTIGTITGVYRISKAIQAANGFSAGKLYSVVTMYALSSSNRRQTFTFMVT